MDYGVHESVSGLKSDAGEEDGYSYFPEHQVGAGGGVGHDLELGAEMADQKADDQRSAGEAELHWLGDSGEHDGDASEYAAEGDAHEDGHEVGVVKALA